MQYPTQHNNHLLFQPKLTISPDPNPPHTHTHTHAHKCRCLTSSEIQVELVCVVVEGSGEVQLHLEGLATADDQITAVEQVSVMLTTVWTSLGAQEVH